MIGMLGDADLVARCQAGDREAFGLIVQRYQSLLCSIAYSATGDLKLSEDLAQESFVIAWRQMRQIREPAKLRSWLCAVARSVLSNWFRRERREPMAGAESIETAHEKPASEPIPSERTITREEETILWQTLQQIPDAYREPLILFYREGESVERVAAVLDISEDAAKQRLSRGRKLLHEKVVALVEGGLRQSIPGKVFTLGVMAALPGVVTSTEAATVGAAATTAGTTAKAAGLGGFVTALSALGPVALAGGWIGRRMGRDEIRGAQQSETVGWVWRMFVGALVVVVPLFLLLMMSEPWFVKLLLRAFRSRDEALSVVTVLIGSIYVVIFGALGVWVFRQRKRRVDQEIAPVTDSKGAPSRRWVVLAMIGASVLLGALFSDSNWGVRKLTAEQIRQLAEKPIQAEFTLEQWRNGSRYLSITVAQPGKKLKFYGPVDEPTLASLAAKGISYPTYIEGKDFGVFGWPGNLLPFVCVFILAAGMGLLLFHPKFATQKFTMKAITAGIVGAAIALAAIGTALALRHHRDQQFANQGDPFQMKQLSEEENAHYTALSPEQATRDFFEACGRGDWNEVEKFCAGIMPLDERIKEWLTGVTVTSIGQSFTRPGYPGTYVPYKIRFKNGERKRFNLAIRRDNPQGRWMFDGGL
jgi:RNA polymerase sigma factor (sigma-70 family)